VDAEAPVADRVAEALDDDGAVVGQRAGRGALVVEIAQQVRGGALVAAGGGEAGVAALRRQGRELAHEGAERAPQLGRAAEGVSAPERHLAGRAGRR
jgi:hypothetical protein